MCGPMGEWGKVPSSPQCTAVDLIVFSIVFSIVFLIMFLIDSVKRFVYKIIKKLYYTKIETAKKKKKGKLPELKEISFTDTSMVIYSWVWQ